MNEINEKIITVGMKVENFEFEGYDPKKNCFSKFSLKDSLKGKKWTVLVYYPADFTFVCPTELEDLAEKHSELEKMGVNVLSVSCDTKFVHMAWKENEKLLKNVSYFMATDPLGKMAKKFGVFDENSGVSYRATIIINPDGILSGVEVNLNNVGRNMDELVRKIKALIYTYNNPQEVCPAKWEPGKKTLKPSEELVGKVYKNI
ncbi:MAG: redoxin domain-containing protein [Elusimicrobiota bacterium]